MEEITTIGLDIAKHVFHVHGVDERGRMQFSRRVSRSGVLAFFARQPRCVVALEACGGAHYWSRELERRRYDVAGHLIDQFPDVGDRVLPQLLGRRQDAAVGRPHPGLQGAVGQLEQHVALAVAVEVADARDLKVEAHRLRRDRGIVHEPAARLAEPVGDRPIRAAPEDVGLAVAVEVVANGEVRRATLSQQSFRPSFGCRKGPGLQVRSYSQLSLRC
jgi:hypothetical protein